jgi:hypothetical protein
VFSNCCNNSFISNSESSFLSNETSLVLREYIINNFGIRIIVDCKQKVFDDASVESIIFCFDKKTTDNWGDYFQLNNNQFLLKHKFNFNEFRKNKNFIISANIGINQKAIFEKVKTNSNMLSDYFIVMGGIKEYQIGKGKPPQIKEMKEGNIFNSNQKINECRLGLEIQLQNEIDEENLYFIFSCP